MASSSTGILLTKKNNHLGAHGEPVAAAHARIDLEAHVVGHVELAHVHQRVQRVLFYVNRSVTVAAECYEERTMQK